jgi:catechol 2,3-dioxygenase-like lactoylglutathione lyase family enzyme
MIKLFVSGLCTAAIVTCLSIPLISQAQTDAPNATGISAGHTHLIVPNVAKHREIWKLLGGVERTSGRLQTLMFPGMHILLREGEPNAPSIATTANHIGFTINDYALYKAKLEAVGAGFYYDDGKGQILADLPDGVRIELALEPDQEEPIRFHHTHLSPVETGELRQWYVDVFGAEIGERRGLPSAVIPGGRVDFIPNRDGEPLPTQGSAIDHIGFEVSDLDVFAERVRSMGITFNREPECIEAIALCIAFITDPRGTYIELTQGLVHIK